MPGRIYVPPHVRRGRRVKGHYRRATPAEVREHDRIVAAIERSPRPHGNPYAIAQSAVQKQSDLRTRRRGNTSYVRLPRKR